MKKYKRKRNFMFKRSASKNVKFKRIRFIVIVMMALFFGISYANGGIVNKFIQYVAKGNTDKVAETNVNEAVNKEASSKNVEKNPSAKNTSTENKTISENKTATDKNTTDVNADKTDKGLLSGESLKDVEFDKADTASPEIQKIKSDIEAYLSDKKGLYGIYYFDIETKQHFGINHTAEYVAASTVKVPLNMYLCKEVTNGTVDLKSELTYLAEDYEGGTGKLRYKEFGSKYAIAELSDLSITYSDNVATNMLIRHLGRKNFKDYMTQCGGNIVRYDDNVSSPVDMAKYLKIIYDLYKSENIAAVNLMNSLQNTQFNTRLPSKLPKEVKVAHKIGNQIGSINDVGIIFTEKPYILSVMSKEVGNELEADEVIGTISKMIYDFKISLK